MPRDRTHCGFGWNQFKRNQYGSWGDWWVRVVLLILAYAAIIAYEMPGTIRRKERGELALFIALVVLAFTLSLLQAIGVPVPNPAKGIEFLTGRLARLFE